uniref:cDNA, clone: J065189C09, full insert sequence n=1 Tax=Oryza sativa subsp. japonica TaxID=39947 RepID=B7F8X8_ORYSJ|nr:unnamed protein product [Oryza sativa Japonica Group]
MLHDVLVPVHHVREGGGDRGQGLDVVRRQRRAVRAAGHGHRLPVHLLLHLPGQDARTVRPRRRRLRRLLRPLLVRVLRAVPGVPGARRPRLRPQARLAPQRRARRRRRARRAAHGPLNSVISPRTSSIVLGRVKWCPVKKKCFFWSVRSIDLTRSIFFKINYEFF